MPTSQQPTDLELLELRAAAVGDGNVLRVGPAVPQDLTRDVEVVYLIEPGTMFASDAMVQRSDRPLPPWMRDANPGGWHPIEWDELLDGRLGPWAMVAIEHRVVSICHTPVVSTAHTAECGVWTDPHFRRRGHAATATAQWADVLRPSARHLFYSTLFENLSSQRVAQRLNARLLGWCWRSDETSEQSGCSIHPLSSARSVGVTGRR